MLVDIAMLVQVLDMEEPTQIELLVRITHEDSEPSGIEDAHLSFTPQAEALEGDIPRTITLPVQINAQELMIDRPGIYELSVEKDGMKLNSFLFTAE